MEATRYDTGEGGQWLGLVVSSVGYKVEMNGEGKARGA